MFIVGLELIVGDNFVEIEETDLFGIEIVGNVCASSLPLAVSKF